MLVKNGKKNLGRNGANQDLFWTKVELLYALTGSYTHATSNIKL